ncbi:MAG: gliding motility-associated C-terminal domain-containing protein [Crocinitomicaceae bacterium]|nr:gliding motility-associated C-terminal domain-containing protein [Crocinitomicaceae bacterium]
MIRNLRLFLLLLCFTALGKSMVSIAQCPLAPVVTTLVQPTCTTPTATATLVGLPSGNWDLYATPVGVTQSPTPTQSGTGSTAVVGNLSPGTSYTFVYIDATVPCTSQVSSTVNINAVPSNPPAPIAGVVQQPNCAPGVTTGSVPLSNLPTTGQWIITATGPGPTTYTQTGIGPNHTFTNLPIGSYTFTVTLISSACTSAPSNNVFVNAPINPNEPQVGVIQNPTCASNTGDVFLTGLPSTGTWTLNASPGSFSQTGTGTTATFTGLPAGVSYLFTVTNNQSCTSVFSTSATIGNALTIPPAPAATVIQPTCPSPTGTITVTAPIGTNYVYSINGANFQSGTIFTNVPGGVYTLYVQDTTSNCITTSLTTYLVNPTPQAPAVSIDFVNNVSCNGAADGSAAVQVDSLGTPPFVFSWSPTGVSNDTITGLAPGNYNIVVVDALNCVVVNSITITEPNAMAILGDSTPVDCNLQLLGTMDVTVSGGTAPYSYIWSPGNQVTDSIGGLNVGSYSVTVTDGNGCSVVWGANIGIINGLALNIQPNDTVINPGTSFNASVNLGTSFSWTPSEGLSCDDCPNPSVSPDSTALYYVTAVDDNGCIGTDSLLVTVRLLCGEYFVPTIFSPNGTGPKANNEFRVFGKEVCVIDFNLVVYDRWGEKVFESISIQNAWDGFYKGRPAQEGNYVYDLNIQLYDDSILHKSGSLTLVR